MINEKEVTSFVVENELLDHKSYLSPASTSNLLNITVPFQDFKVEMDFTSTNAQSVKALTSMDPKCLPCFLTSQINQVRLQLINLFILDKFKNRTQPIQQYMNNNIDYITFMRQMLSTHLPVIHNFLCKPCSYSRKVLSNNPNSQLFYPCKSAYVKRVTTDQHFYTMSMLALTNTATEIPSLKMIGFPADSRFYLPTTNESKSQYERSNHSWMLLSSYKKSFDFNLNDIGEIFPHFDEWRDIPFIKKHIDKLPKTFMLHYCTQCGNISFEKRNSKLTWIPSVRLSMIDHLENYIPTGIKDLITNPKTIYFLEE